MKGVVWGPGGSYSTMPDVRVNIDDYLDEIRISMLAMLEICGAAEG
jgi:acetylornithine deacetylase